MTVAELESGLASNESEYLSAECAALNQLLQVDLNSLATIHSLEDRWRNSYQNGGDGFDPRSERMLITQYEKWLDRAKQHLCRLEIEERAGCLPKVAGDFRARVDEVEDDLEIRIRADVANRARSAMWHSEAG